MNIRSARCQFLAASLLAACAGLPAAADDASDAIIKAAYKKLGDAKTMSAEITCKIEVEGLDEPIEFKGTVAAMKPNLLRVELKGKVPMAGEIEQIFAADGKNYFTYNSGANACIKAKLEAKPTEFLGLWEGEIDAFFGGEKAAAKFKTESGGTAKVGDVECDVVKVETKAPDGSERIITYTVGKKDSLIYRASYSASGPGQPETTQTNTLAKIKLGVDKTEKDFAYEPPEGTRIISRRDDDDK